MTIIKGKMGDEKEMYLDLLPAGLRFVKILEADVEKSAKGNENLVTVIEDVKTGARNKFWFSIEDGKRWHFRNLIGAAGLFEEDIDGNYEVETSDLKGLTVGAFIFHADETYTTKDYTEATRKRAKIKRFYTKEETENKMKEEAKKSEKSDDEIPF
jgi:hypothetical protein